MRRPRSPSCPPRRRPSRRRPPRPWPPRRGALPRLTVERVEDGLEIAALLAAQPFTAFLAVAFVDDRHQLVDLVAIDGDRDDLERFAEDVVRIAVEGADHAIVLFSTQQRPPEELAEADVACWRRLRDRSRESGVRLLDWFLLGGGDGSIVRSMAETAGHAPDGSYRP